MPDPVIGIALPNRRGCEQRLGVGAVEGTREQITLSRLTTKCAELGELLARPPPLGHHIHTQTVGELGNGAYDLQIVLVARHIVDKGFVDLDRVDR